MLVATLALTIAAAGLLAAGLWLSSAGLITGSVAASLSAALVLVTGTWRRRSRAPAPPPYTVPAQEPARRVDVAVPAAAGPSSDEPGPQAVSAEDAARVAAMGTAVRVIDSRPRYHLSGCVHLLGRESEALPAAEAVALGFTPCSLCEPASALLAQSHGQ